MQMIRMRDLEGGGSGAPLPPDPTAPGTGNGAQSAATPPPLSEDDRRKAVMASKMLMAAFGEITSLLMRTPQHKHSAMGDLEWLVVPAILTGQFSLVESQSKTHGFTAPVAVALWAFVSAEVDQRLTANIAQPIRLKPEEWKSGDIPWLVEAAGEPRIIEEMLKRLLAGPWAGRDVRMRARTQGNEFKVGLISVAKGEAAS